MFAGAGEVAFQPTGVADAAFRVIDKTKQIRTTSTGAIAVDVDAQLIREILHAEAWPRFLDDEREAILVEEKRRTRSSVAVAGRPLLCADVIELEAQQGMEQILHVELVFDIQRRSVFAAQP
jgi:hypothetical protein